MCRTLFIVALAACTTAPSTQSPPPSALVPMSWSPIQEPGVVIFEEVMVNGTPRIVVGDAVGGRVHLQSLSLDAQGNLHTRSTSDAYGPTAVFGHATVAEVRVDADKEIVFGDSNGVVLMFHPGNLGGFDYFVHPGDIDGITAYDTDGDGWDELFILDSGGDVSHVDRFGTLITTVPGGGFWSVAVGQADGDASAEVVTDAGQLVDLATGVVQQVFPSAANTMMWDVDGDGEDEIVLVEATDCVEIWNGDGSLLWSVSLASQCKGVTRGDTDGDGIEEILVESNGTTHAFDPLDGSALWTRAATSAFFQGRITTDLDQDGVAELRTASAAGLFQEETPTASASSMPSRGLTVGPVAVELGSGTFHVMGIGSPWTLVAIGTGATAVAGESAPLFGGALASVDLDIAGGSSGGSDFVVALGTTSGDSVAETYTPAAGSFVFGNTVSWSGTSAVDVDTLDVDQDGDDELVLATTAGVRIVDASSGVVHSELLLTGVKDVVTGDFDGDGEDDLAILDGTGLTIHEGHNPGTPVFSAAVDAFMLSTSDTSPYPTLLVANHITDTLTAFGFDGAAYQSLGAPIVVGGGFRSAHGMQGAEVALCVQGRWQLYDVITQRPTWQRPSYQCRAQNRLLWDGPDLVGGGKIGLQRWQ